eukprot:Hpha_TRINITY_DN3244_c0_g1::TRINITY_DN3244_c0_g1_i2::g.185757::m.185757
MGRPPRLGTTANLAASFVSCADDIEEAGEVIIVTRARAEQEFARHTSLAMSVSTPGGGPESGVRQLSDMPVGRSVNTGQLENVTFENQPSSMGPPSTREVVGSGRRPSAGIHKRRTRRPTFARATEHRDVGVRCPAQLPASTSKILNAWDFLGSDEGRKLLQDGNSLFACVAAPGKVLSDVERAMVATYIDFSCFGDEFEENGVLPVDMGNDKDLADHIFLLTKGMYLLPPGTNPESFTPGLWSSVDFQRSIAPAGCKVHDKVRDRDGKVIDASTAHTFCTSREVIPWVFSVTTQYKVSVVPKTQLETLGPLVGGGGISLRYALLLERTKQDRGQDPTKKAKQVLLYHALPDGGLLVTQVSFSVFTSLPSVVRKVIDKIGVKGATELGEYVTKLRKKLPFE